MSALTTKSIAGSACLARISDCFNLQILANQAQTAIKQVVKTSFLQGYRI
jgi:hypothetical protein